MAAWARTNRSSAAFGEATETYRSALLLLGFVLFIVTFIVLAIARFMLMQLSRREGN